MKRRSATYVAFLLIKGDILLKQYYINLKEIKYKKLHTISM